MAQPERPDFLKNRNPLAKLGPFDGNVAAVVEMNGVDYLITTHADYVPELPLTAEHDVFLRTDLRYGTDDFTLWPQQFSIRFCHLAAIRTQAAAERDTEIMWWDPTPADFETTQESRSMTQALGKLADARLDSLSKAVHSILLDYKAYIADTTQNKIPPPLNPLVRSLRAVLERLHAVPSTFEEAYLAVRNMQRTFLEVDAIMEYMRVYKPRIEDPLGVGMRPGRLMGVYTGDLGVAQQMHLAGIPYWLVRRASLFHKENIIELVTPRSPSNLALKAHPKHTSICRATNSTDAKIDAIHKCSLSVEWYQDPYASLISQESRGDSGQSGHTGGSSHDRNDERNGGPSRSHAGGRDQRYSPYKQGTSHNIRSPPKPPPGRNKFAPLDRPEMPPTIPSWERALAEVDTSRGPLNPWATDTYYVLPEPALLASPEFVGQRQLRMHHFLMLREALLYRIGNCPGRELLLSSQEWRDVLGGKVAAQGGRHTKSRERTIEIDRLLRPALLACGLDGYRDFPADRERIPPITTNRAKEIIWEIAEINFRFECLSLDRRASGVDRPGECRHCFAGGQLMDIPIALSKQGLAASALSERHPYNLCLATLMCDWKVTTPNWISTAPTMSTWTPNQMRIFESEVAKHYTQTFYELFGRAPVIPMRLEHEFGT
ncbi:hypothetical protein B0H11DRAFT_2230015 [Mycena galericulata]|nr:hypothetical protein B0H11DRAFT_2230015 [Mycena galericulata]